MSSDSPSYLYLIRHGSTANNLMKPPRLQGHGANVGLSETGVSEAQQTSEYLADRPLTAVYSSPLQRAQETARAIAEPHGLEVQIVESLIEADVGRWEGMQWDEIERTDSETYHRFMNDAANHGYPEGENMSQVLSRARPALEELLAKHAGEQIAAVAHNVVNRCYLGHLLGLDATASRGVPQDNCGVNILRRRGDRIRPLTINAVLHLDKID